MTWLWLVSSGLIGILLGVGLTLIYNRFFSHSSNISSIIAPLSNALEELKIKISDQNLTQSQRDINLNQEIKVLLNLYDRLQSGTNNLMKALRNPIVCGRWGEIQLRKVVELAGMLEHCDFEEQVSVQTQNGRLRPDMLIHLPGGKNIIVDAKAPLQAYLDAAEADDEQNRTAKLKDHVRQIRNHINMLASKSYWELFSNTPEFVILFIPGECFFSAAVKEDQDIISNAFLQKVILASPTTLIAILKSIYHVWKQEKITQNAREISELGQKIYEQIISFLELLQKMGGTLSRTVETFNSAIHSLEGSIIPSFQKLQNLEVITKKELPEIRTITTIPHSILQNLEQNEFLFHIENIHPIENKDTNISKQQHN